MIDNKKEYLMAPDKEKSQRRVYVLPNELVERIVQYQQFMGIQSEVEAARRLLDEALKSRDDWRSITHRFKEKLSETRVLSEIAKEVLVGHPLVTSVNFEPEYVRFSLKSGEVVSITPYGMVQAMQGKQKLEFEPEQRNVAAEIAAAKSKPPGSKRDPESKP